jgi:hypothetical protein
MRPRSIVLFDRLFLASIVLSLLQSFYSFSSARAELAADPAAAELGLGSGFMAGSIGISVAISLLLWWLVAHRAGNIAKWILTVLSAIGVVMLPWTLAGPGVDAVVLTLTLAANAMVLAAIFFLFQQDARDWFTNKGRVGPTDPDVFS